MRSACVVRAYLCVCVCVCGMRACARVLVVCMYVHGRTRAGVHACVSACRVSSCVHACACVCECVSVCVCVVVVGRGTQKSR